MRFKSKDIGYGWLFNNKWWYGINQYEDETIADVAAVQQDGIAEKKKKKRKRKKKTEERDWLSIQKILGLIQQYLNGNWWRFTLRFAVGLTSILKLLLQFGAFFPIGSVEWLYKGINNWEYKISLSDSVHLEFNIDNFVYKKSIVVSSSGATDSINHIWIEFSQHCLLWKTSLSV